MIFPILTLLSALGLAVVADWFSITGLVAILAGSPISAIVLGVTLALGKLVSTSWLYRNWNDAPWQIKAPLIYFTLALMLITSMGVFGFLSKSHLEQSAPTLDNSAKVERINQQLEHEKNLIADNDKVISQLDATVNSLIGKDKADRALAVRRSQDSQRKQLKKDSEEIQKTIEELSSEKFKLESEVRKLQIEVGPIRYIAQLIYGQEANDNSSLESAVRMFTLLIVSTLDPLAIILLIAANYSLKKLEDEKKVEIYPPNREEQGPEIHKEEPIHYRGAETSKEVNSDIGNQDTVVAYFNQPEPETKEFSYDSVGEICEPSTESSLPEEISEELVEPDITREPTVEVEIEQNIQEPVDIKDIPVKTLIQAKVATPWMAQTTTLRELLGITHEEEVSTMVETKSSSEHQAGSTSKSPIKGNITGHGFVADRKISASTKVPMDKKEQDTPISSMETSNIGVAGQETEDSSIQNSSVNESKGNFPKTLSWLSEFRRNKDGQ
jgi:hypothetical protein